MADYTNGQKFRKTMVICTPFGEYVNGDQKGRITPARLRAVAERARKYPRQIKAYLNGDHPLKRSERPADGWFDSASVEYTTSYPGYPGGALVAEVDAHGELAAWLINDLVRGASIFTVEGKNPDGTTQGEVLDHVLISDDAFDKSVNIAAAEADGAFVACFTTALPKKEPQMASEHEGQPAADEAVVAQLKETQTLLAEKTREVAELTASNANLKADVERFKSPKAIEELQLQLKAEQRKNRAAEVRRKVAEGVEEGQFSREMVGDPKSGYRHPSDEMVLTWFRESVFKDDMQRLDIMLETMPRKRLNRTFGTGTPNEEVKDQSLTATQKNDLRLQGQDPDAVEAAMKSADSGSFIAQQKSKAS